MQDFRSGGQFKAHEGLIGRIGSVAVDALFQLAQGPTGARINDLRRPFGMPTAIGQG